MMFSNACMRSVLFSKIGDILQGGRTRLPDPPVSTKAAVAPKTGDPSAPKSDAVTGHWDQGSIDSKVDGFKGDGQPSGTRAPGDVKTPESEGVAEYRAEQQKKWQAQKDAETRDKLFGSPTAARVDGNEVEPYSSHALEENSDGLVKAAAAEKSRAPVATRKDIAKVATISASVTVPLTVVGAVVGGTVNEFLKPVINPTAPPATAQSVEEGRLVDHSQKSVFLLANTLADLRSQAHVEPTVEWVAKTNEERMDYLEEMVDFVETEFAKEAKTRGIPFQAASTGEQKDDIKNRVTGLESRMAALTALMGAITAKIKAEAV